jgi:ankyrin repeat protein
LPDEFWNWKVGNYSGLCDRYSPIPFNQAVTYGNTPLILACKKGAVEVGEFLFNQGADVTLTNRDRETALMKACAVASL